MSVQPGPIGDPYSTLSGVRFLDEKLAILHARILQLGESVRNDGDLTRLQKSSLQLIPASSSIAKSIRQLIKEGYLLSAMALFRPLIERVATLSYLSKNSEAVDLWEAGWPHGQRPSLQKRLITLMPGASEEILADFTTAVTKYNSLVHGDPLAAQQSLMQTSEHDVAYAPDRDYATPGRASGIALETAIAVVFLLVIIDTLFPGSDPLRSLNEYTND
ncbi:hypothetical protein HS048_07055 [Planomonospora sp. ID91781]|uniref:DUF5677 domain-containing protein n=1 Tax=Planomonospora sp. ID91781 TaxID=2738135 RepID=UPI0018C3E6A8|nr:DUF5677 domain-containing protein [Planomonospora sp. ID91781]MBG0820491.1 hypothetical protein [Planomonospora sp. ID91781]